MYSGNMIIFRLGSRRKIDLGTDLYSAVYNQWLFYYWQSTPGSDGIRVDLLDNVIKFGCCGYQVR